MTLKHVCFACAPKTTSKRSTPAAQTPALTASRAAAPALKRYCPIPNATFKTKPTRQQPCWRAVLPKPNIVISYIQYANSSKCAINHWCACLVRILASSIINTQQQTSAPATVLARLLAITTVKLNIHTQASAPATVLARLLAIYTVNLHIHTQASAPTSVLARLLARNYYHVSTRECTLTDGTPHWGLYTPQLGIAVGGCVHPIRVSQCRVYVLCLVWSPC